MAGLTRRTLIATLAAALVLLTSVFALGFGLEGWGSHRTSDGSGTSGGPGAPLLSLSPGTVNSNGLTYWYNLTVISAPQGFLLDQTFFTLQFANGSYVNASLLVNLSLVADDGHGTIKGFYNFSGRAWVTGGPQYLNSSDLLVIRVVSSTGIGGAQVGFGKAGSWQVYQALA